MCKFEKHQLKTSLNSILLSNNILPVLECSNNMLAPSSSTSKGAISYSSTAVSLLSKLTIVQYNTECTGSYELQSEVELASKQSFILHNSKIYTHNCN